MKKYFLLLSGFVFFAFACKTDFNVNGPYKDTTVIFGLLNPDTNVQLIRVNKAFLGDGNAYVMAQNKDSVNYNPADITVEIKRSVNGNQIGSTEVLKDTLIDIENGIFSKKQVVYLYKLKPGNAKTDTLYSLALTNKKTGKVVSASTFLPGLVKINGQSGSQAPSINLTDGFDMRPLVQIVFNAPANSRQFNIILRFWYSEFRDSDNSLVETNYVDYDLGLQEGNPSSTMAFTFSAETFYTNLANKIPVKNGIHRKQRLINGKPSDIELIVTSITPELYNYMLVNRPSTGIAQERPEYTNIQNGLGMFSGRSKQYISSGLSANSYTVLCNNGITSSLNFKKN